MKYHKVIEIDKGPVIRFIANTVMGLSGFLVSRFSKYATMYEVEFDSDELKNLEIPHNQMVIEEEI